MEKLAALSGFLINLNLFAVEDFDSWVEDPKIVPSGELLSEGGIVLFRYEYDAVFAIDRFPHGTHSAELLFGHFCAWLMENDEREQIAEPRVDVDVIDDQVAEIQMGIDFREDVTAVDDPAGPIELNGKRYRLGTPETHYVTGGDLAAL